MGKERGGERGLLSLEASIALTVFMFLMFFIYSFFVVFEARNEMAHVLLSTADSLSLDAYQNSALGESGTIGQVIYKLYGMNANPNDRFVARGSGDLKEDAKARFLAYLTGGDISRAEEILKRYHVKGGVAGLDFSETYVDDKGIHLSVKYTLEYEFQVFHGGEVQLRQSVCSKLWK